MGDPALLLLFNDLSHPLLLAPVLPQRRILFPLPSCGRACLQSPSSLQSLLQLTWCEGKRQLLKTHVAEEAERSRGRTQTLRHSPEPRRPGAAVLTLVPGGGLPGPPLPGARRPYEHFLQGSCWRLFFFFAQVKLFGCLSESKDRLLMQAFC